MDLNVEIYYAYSGPDHIHKSAECSYTCGTEITRQLTLSKCMRIGLPGLNIRSMQEAINWLYYYYSHCSMAGSLNYTPKIPPPLWLDHVSCHRTRMNNLAFITQVVKPRFSMSNEWIKLQIGMASEAHHSWTFVPRPRIDTVPTLSLIGNAMVKCLYRNLTLNRSIKPEPL